MPDSPYDAFFAAAYGDNRTRYGYHCRLAESASDGRLITVPTGLVDVI